QPRCRAALCCAQRACWTSRGVVGPVRCQADLNSLDEKTLLNPPELLSWTPKTQSTHEKNAILHLLLSAGVCHWTGSISSRIVWRCKFCFRSHPAVARCGAG